MIYFNIDTWTAKTIIEYQAIIAFFVTAKGERKKALLALSELDASHARSECGPRFVATVKDYGIEGQLGYITYDNTTANDTICRYIEAELDSGPKPVT